jgi:hypothetical protein
MMMGDPHIFFAHGGKADFRGENNSWYNLLSSKNVSINALFTNADFKLMKPMRQLVHGSRMEQLGMVIRTNSSRLVRVAFNATDTFPANVNIRQESEPAHHLMRLTTDKKTTRSYHIDNLQLSLRMKRVGVVANGGHGVSLVVSTGEWEVSATSKPFPNPRAHPGKALLNLDFRPLYDADHDVVAPHGLIGQSFDGSNLRVDGRVDDYSGAELTTSANAEGAIEGVGSDYKMASRFETQFKYSRFGALAASPRDVTKLTGIKQAAQGKVTDAVGMKADVEDPDETAVEATVEE